MIASLLLGAGDVGPGRALSALLGGADGDARFTVLELRLPRTLVAVAVGLALGIAGALLQAAARNPLAEPGLLGVSAGASFAVVVALVLGASAATLGPYVAVLGASAGCLLALGAARLRGAGDDPVRLVLAGAAFSGLMAAGSSVLLLVDARAADEIRFWTIGSVAGRELADLWAVVPVVGLGLLLAVLVAPALTALSLGDDVATGLGHKPGRSGPSRSLPWPCWSAAPPPWPVPSRSSDSSYRSPRALWSARTCAGCWPSPSSSAPPPCSPQTSSPGSWPAPTRCPSAS